MKKKESEVAVLIRMRQLSQSLDRNVEVAVEPHIMTPYGCERFSRFLNVVITDLLGHSLDVTST